MSREHTRHLTNLDAAEVPAYQAAIEATGFDLSIREGAYDCLGRMWDASRYSLWAAMVPTNLTEFWRLVEGR